MGDLISNATSSFNTTTGFEMSSLVTWMADTLLKPFLGGGLSVLYELRYWIIALLVISIIVYFAFRAFRFYRR